MKTRINLFLVNGLFISLALGFSVLLFLTQLNDKALAIATQEQEEAIKTFWHLLHEKGTDFRIVDGRLMAGTYVINGNFELPDTVKSIFGGTATIFMGDTRVSTNVLKEDGSRAIGTRLQGPAYDAIFTQNSYYRGEAPILGIPYLTAYDPIRDASGKTIGVLYVGVKKGDFFKDFKQLEFNIIIGTAIICLLFLSLAFGILGERRRDETKHLEKARQYLALINKMLNGFALFEVIRGSDESCADLRYLAVNEAHERHTGLSREHVVGKTLRELFPGEENNWCKLIQELSEQATPRQIEFYSPMLGKWFEMATYTPQEGQVAFIFSDITHRRAAHEKIQRVAQILSETTGATFFSSLVENLAALLQAEYVFIGEVIDDSKDRIQVLASYSHGKPADTFCYTLAGTPCAEVVQGSFCFCPDGVSRKYPGNQLLDDMAAEGFIGVPLTLANGRIVGMLGVLDSKPLRRKEDAESICQLFATRAATEMERMQSDIRLQQSADKIRLIIDSVPASIAYVDAESRYRFANCNYARLFNFNIEELIGRPVHEQMGRRSSVTMRENIQEVLTGKTVTFLNQTSGADGQAIFLQTSYVPHLGQQGNVLGFFVQHLDITERKLMEDTLNTQVNFLQTLIDAIPNPIFYKDRAGRYLGYNRSFESYLGLPGEQLVGRTVYDISPKALADRYHEMDEALFVNPGTQAYESSVVYADGIRHDVIFNKATFTDADGGVGGLVGVILDVTDRKKAEDMLAEREEFLSCIFDSIQDGISILDEELRLIRANPVIERRFSEKMPLVGRKCHEAYHGRTEPCAQCPSLETIRSGKPSFKTFSIEVNDIECWLELHTYPLFDSKKSRIMGIIEYTRDVTEQHRVEEALVSAEKKFRSLVEQSLVGAYIIQDGKFVYVNPKMAEIFGYSQEELTSGISHLDLTVEGDRPLAAENVRRRIAGEVQSVHYGFRGLRKDGATINAEVYGTGTRFNGRPAVIGTLLDVTARNRAEAALRESEERFHQVFAQNGDAIILVRMDSFAIIDANHAAEELTGYTMKELRELTPSSFIDQKDFRRLIDMIPIEDHSQAFQLDRATSTRKNGSTMFVAIRGKILRLREEYVVHCSIRDMTEKLHLEEEIRATQAKLIQANKMTSLGMLSSSVAHEINNPNNCISVNASMLTEVWQDTEKILKHFHEENGEFDLRGVPYSKMQKMIPRLFHGITEGSRRINAIVDNMKDFVREDKSGTQIELDINKLIRSAASILWHHIHKCTDNFQMVLQDDLLPARGNGQQIEQVIINLLMNALQALPDKKCSVCIMTSCDRNTGEIIITVRDEGEGMSKNVMAHLREPFFTTKLDTGGTGLGLYISDSIMKEHRGSLEFASNPGRGTVATIQLPAA